MHEVRVAPSILSADFARLGAQVETVMDAGARVIHVDVMDGHFVPPITIGALIVDALRDLVHERGGVLDVHLMVERPERRVEEFAAAGADSIAVHWEATPHVHYALKAVRDAGRSAGLAINPATPPAVVSGLSDDIDHVLCMTVNPGWGGQSFIEASIPKLERLRQLLPASCTIEVDGGVDTTTAARCVEAGATLLVAGSHVFGAADPAERYRALAATVGAV
jgi:ribulose-phosphate 3-epimerase